MYRYSVKQIREFAAFCKKHNMTFINLAQYHSAMAQYFEG